jgi:hypothetical protein
MSMVIFFVDIQLSASSKNRGDGKDDLPFPNPM